MSADKPGDDRLRPLVDQLAAAEGMLVQHNEVIARFRSWAGQAGGSSYRDDCLATASELESQTGWMEKYVNDCRKRIAHLRELEGPR